MQFVQIYFTYCVFQTEVVQRPNMQTDGEQDKFIMFTCHQKVISFAILSIQHPV